MKREVRQVYPPPYSREEWETMFGQYPPPPPPAPFWPNTDKPTFLPHEQILRIRFGYLWRFGLLYRTQPGFRFALRGWRRLFWRLYWQHTKIEESTICVTYEEKSRD